jgi:hypothetical protein
MMQMRTTETAMQKRLRNGIQEIITVTIQKIRVVKNNPPEALGRWVRLP